MRLLLDTCTFLWIASNDSRLSLNARELFLDESNLVYLSSMSAWEIGIKAQLSRLPLPKPAAEYVKDARARHGIESLPFDEKAALMLATLPLHHKDPFDRALVAQAISQNMVILTP